MKSIDNIKKLTGITIALFITAALTASTPAIMSTDAYADHGATVDRDMLSEAPSVVAGDTRSGIWHLHPPISTPIQPSAEPFTPIQPSAEPFTPIQPSAEPFPTPTSPWSCASKIINDSPEGNALGWNPNGTDTVFTISEPCYFEADSTVLVNIKDGGVNYEACNVDYNSDQFFEIYCNAPPAEGSELRYLVLVQDLEVIGAQTIPIEELPEDLAERKQNATQ